MKIYRQLCCHFLLLCTLAAAGELPYDVQQLIVQRDAAISKINLKYVNELEKLKIKYTKSGDLDSANDILGLINKITKISPQEKDVAGKFVSGNDRIELEPDGNAIHSQGVNGNWKLENSRLVIRWKNGYVDTYDYPGQEDIFTGKNQLGTTISMMRKK